jgi:hypothetical protein
MNNKLEGNVEITVFEFNPPPGLVCLFEMYNVRKETGLERKGWGDDTHV